MSARNKQKLGQSASVALVFALILPALWVSITGEISRTPVVEKQFIDSMPEVERKAWIAANSKPEGFVGRMKSMPSFIENHWRGYLGASTGVFLVVFVFNSAILLSGRRNEP